MILFNKNTWHGFFMTIFSFYAVFTFINNLLAVYEIDFVQEMRVPLNYYWIIAYLAAFLISMLMVAIFCKVKSPIFQGISVLIAGILSMYESLYLLLTNMDQFFRQDGLAALIYLLPHFMVILGALAAYVLIGLSTEESSKKALSVETTSAQNISENPDSTAPSVVTVTKTEIESEKIDVKKEEKIAKKAEKAEKKAAKKATKKATAESENISEKSEN